MSADIARQHIRDLEKSVASGDVAALARLINRIHDDWPLLPEAEREEILKLEARFITLVHAEVKGSA